MSDKTYVVEEYTPSCTCPVCGGKMTPVEYYLAAMGDVSVNVDRSQIGTGKVTKTTTAQYKNVRRKIGGVCVPCHVKQQQGFQREYQIKAIVLCAVVLGGLGFFLWSMTGGSEEKKIGFLGIVIALAAGYYALKWFSKSLLIHTYWAKQLNSASRDETLSDFFVLYGNRVGFGGGETLLSPERVKQMKKQ